MKYLPEGIHTVHARCIFCKYEIYKYDGMKEERMKIRKRKRKKKKETREKRKGKGKKEKHN
jgi:hypothetical protein